MPPLYDWECPNPDCKAEHTEMLNFEQYSEWEPVKCEKCGQEITKDNRVMGRGLRTTVNGVRKGNYNSNDWS